LNQFSYKGIRILLVPFLLLLFSSFLFLSPSITSSGNLFYVATSQTDESRQPVGSFTDNSTGISVQYPPDWQLISDDYLRIIFGSALENLKNQSQKYSSLEHIVKPVVGLTPKSLNGASMVLMYELLPFPISAETFMNSSLTFMGNSSLEIDQITRTSIDGIQAIKVDMRDTSNNVELRQIYLTKDSRGFLIQYLLGEMELARNVDAINSILNSIKIA
jgi:hypothetical protein